jgi:hypothetical protein
MLNNSRSSEACKHTLGTTGTLQIPPLNIIGNMNTFRLNICILLATHILAMSTPSPPPTTFAQPHSSIILEREYQDGTMTTLRHSPNNNFALPMSVFL